MQTENLIPVEEICTHHHVETTFVESLQEYGLIEVVVLENTPYLPLEQLQDFEKILRLHYELHINLEGIDAVTHLLRQMDQLRQELMATKNRLSIFD